MIMETKYVVISGSYFGDFYPETIQMFSSKEYAEKYGKWIVENGMTIDGKSVEIDHYRIKEVREDYWKIQ